MPRRLLTQLLLALALLVGQQVALAHAISHLAGSDHPHHEGSDAEEHGLPHGKLCVECLSSSHLAQALPSSLTVPLCPRALAAKAPVRIDRTAAVALAFRSRAPPAAL